MSVRYCRVLILGAGPAGYSAAVYAARAGLKPIVLSGMQPGGQLTITTDVENYPGFALPIQGPWLMDQMQAQATRVGAEIIFDTVVSVDFERRPFSVKTEDENTYICDALIVATGAKARWLGIPGEKELSGFGVSACATCDGFFYRNKEVAVIGGGNTAVEEALYLANLASRVTLVHRRDALRAERILQERLFSHPNVTILWNQIPERFVADQTGSMPVLKAVALKDTTTGATAQLNVSGAFVAIGHDPTTQLFDGKLEMDAERYIVTAPDSTRTNVSGVFAAGDVQDRVFRQAVTAAGSGCMAALEAEKWLAESRTMAPVAAPAAAKAKALSGAPA
jgi:thioredoxin reductase (NADPH)